MYKTGIVTNIDENNPRVRVRFPDLDDMMSGWLQIVYPFTNKDKSCYMPSENEQVACIMDENYEDGCVIGAVYSDEDKPPVTDKNKFHTRFEDGTVLEYDKKEHKLTANVQGSMEITASTAITLKAPILNFNGNISHTGNMNTSGTYSAVGVITSSADCVSAGKSGKSHTHPAPGGSTGAPN